MTAKQVFVKDAVSPLVFGWSMLDRGSHSAASRQPRLAPSVFLPSPRWTHPARVAVVALTVTGLVGIQEIPQQREPREGTCRPPQHLPEI